MYKKYNGNDKYHFRIYKHGKNHPIIVVMVTVLESDGKIYLSGYQMTHSEKRALKKPHSYIKLIKNPNPNDNRKVFVSKTRLTNIDANSFSKPYTNWHLSLEDELIIDQLEEKKNPH